MRPEEIQRLAESYPLVTMAENRRDSVSDIQIRGGPQRVSGTVAYLVEQGHRSIGYVGPSAHGPGLTKAGYVEALQVAGIEVRQDLMIAEGSGTVEDGQSTGHLLLPEHPEMTAVCCHDDLMAGGFLDTCRQRGMVIPRDLSVTGFGNVPLSRLITPTLTTMEIPRFQMGKMVTEMLFTKMGNPERFRRRSVECKLIVRESTARHTD